MEDTVVTASMLSVHHTTGQFLCKVLSGLNVAHGCGSSESDLHSTGTRFEPSYPDCDLRGLHKLQSNTGLTPNITKTASFQIPSNLATPASKKWPPRYKINMRRSTDSWSQSSGVSCEGRHGFSRHSGLGWGSIYNTPHASLPQGNVPTAASLKIQVFWDVKPCGLVNSHRGLGTAYCPQLQCLAVLTS
jgi:hypothetical protein